MPAYGSPKSTKVTAFSNWSPSSTATAAISASQKSDKTNWPGQAPIRSIPISSGTGPDYFRSTPTKATIPISVPTKIPANHWHRYATAPMPKTKTDNRLTTSTATKSAYRKRWPASTAICYDTATTPWDRLKEEIRVTDTAYPSACKTSIIKARAGPRLQILMLLFLLIC